MNQVQLVQALKNDSDLTHDQAREYLHRLCDIIHNELCRGGDVTLPGVGKLSVVGRPARKGRNPRTGAAIDVPASKAVKFTAAKALKDAIRS